MSTLVLHVGFFGRLISLYTRNFLRVQYLSHMVKVYQLQILIDVLLECRRLYKILMLSLVVIIIIVRNWVIIR
jgi:hypothetical protein